MSRRLPRSFLSRMAPCPYPPVDLQLRAMATTSKAVSTSTGAFNTGLAATASGVDFRTLGLGLCGVGERVE